jgi:hypothetical protein
MLEDQDRYVARSNERNGFDGTYNSGDWGASNNGWDDHQSEELLKSVGFFIGIIAALLVLPIAIVAVIFYWAMFRLLRYRPLFTAAVDAVVTLIAVKVFNDHGGFAPLVSFIRSYKFDGFGSISPFLSSIAPTFIGTLFMVGFIVGPWIALIMELFQINRMKTSPFLVVNEGVGPKWMYHFRFNMSPIEIIKKSMMIRSIKSDSLKPHHRNDLIPLGVEEEPLNAPEDPSKIKKDVLVCRAEDEVPKHTMVTGAAGSGKTVTLKSMMTRDIDAHKTVFMIDCKKDPEVAEFLSRRAKEAGCNFYHFSTDLPYMIQGNPEGPSSYDPLSSGSTSKKVDMMLNTREWDTASAVYREQAQAFLSKVFAVMDEARKYGILDKVKALDTTYGQMWTFTQMLDPPIFNAVIVAMNQIPEASYIRQQASELNELLSSPRRDAKVQAAQHSQQEYLSTMTGLMTSSYGKWLRGGESAGSGKIINITDLSSEPGNVVLFSLDAAQKGDMGSFMGSIICTDLANMTETRKNLGQDNPLSVYIDEFQSLPPECVKSMLQKARSADVGLSLAFQSLDQVSASTGSDTYVKSLLDTCSNFIFHAGSNYDTGLMASKIIGTHKKNIYIVNRRNETKLGAFNWNNNRDLQVNTAPSDEWIVDPSEFAKLSMPNKQNGYKSEAIIIKKASSDPIDKKTVGAVAHKTKMIPPDCVLTEYFDPHAKPIDIDAPIDVRMSRGFARDAKKAIAGSQIKPVTAPASMPVDIHDHDDLRPARRTVRRMPSATVRRSVDDHDDAALPMPDLDGSSEDTVPKRPQEHRTRHRPIRDTNGSNGMLPMPSDEPRKPRRGLGRGASLDDF